MSGLSKVIGKFFVNFRDFPAWLLALLMSTFTAVLTEVTSNIATSTIFLQIVAELVGARPASQSIATTDNDLDLYFCLFFVSQNLKRS